MHIIFPDADHDLALQLSGLQSLEDHRDHLDRAKFAKLKDPKDRLNCLLPQKCDYSYDVCAKLSSIPYLNLIINILGMIV